MTAAPRDPSAGFEQLLDYRRLLLERLEQQPAEFAALVAAVPADAWHTPSDAQGRSLLRVAAHIRDVEAKVHLPRIRRVLAEAQPHLTIEADHDDASAAFDPREPMTDVLAAWSQVRAELVSWLAPLDPAGWTRTGFYPPAGNRTVQWWAERAYGHVKEHQIALQ